MDGGGRQSGEVYQEARAEVMSVSAVILTLNEERNIVECIGALREWCDDIVVYDSFSSDRTVELANELGARVFQRRFDNYAAQRNAALREIEYPNKWVLMVDADERWGKELGERILEFIKSSDDGVGIVHFQRCDMFMGKWLKHNIGAGTWSGRLLRLDRVEVRRDINEEYHTTGEKVYMRAVRFVHYPFSNGINYWFTRHNRYSDMEAARLLAERGEGMRWRDLLRGGPVERRKAMKQLFYRLPGRPVLLFGWLYFVKLGFLDGRAGFHYTVLRCIYEYMIVLKMQEMRERER
ncbi:MAG: glycosyltransferase family 2 protein [Lentisphaerae bacterium]|nr:glycosyltransferase family 2 protein [Lentisphaerota bacterium]